MFVRERFREGVVALTAAFAAILIGSRLPGWDTTRVSLVGTITGVVVLAVWEVGRHGLLGNLSLGYQRPVWTLGSTGQLRRDSLKLARQLRKYLDAHRLPPLKSWDGITNFDTPQGYQDWRQTMRECEALFGADSRVIAEAYRVRGMLDETETRHLSYKCTDPLHMAAAASDIEALARRL